MHYKFRFQLLSVFLIKVLFLSSIPCKAEGKETISNSEVNEASEKIESNKRKTRVATSAKDALSPIPKTPSTPPSYSHKEAEVYFGCKREFVHNKKSYACDSFAYRDAAHLLTFVSQNPKAKLELIEYQKNKKTLKNLSYVGSVGVVMLLTSLIVAPLLDEPIKNKLSKIGLIGGIAITGGSLIYGFSLLHSNEKRIQNAVDYYNQANPETRIELKFSTELKDLFL